MVMAAKALVDRRPDPTDDDIKTALGGNLCRCTGYTRIIDAVSIPVMAKARIGHFVEAQVLQSLGVDYIDESEVLTPVDEHHIDKRAFTVPFVNGAKDLGEALRRIGEGAAMIRTKGEPGTGNVVEAVRHMRSVTAGTVEAINGLKIPAARPIDSIVSTMPEKDLV